MNLTLLASPEFVDALVVVANGQDAQLCLLTPRSVRPAIADISSYWWLINVLILVHQDVPEAGQQPFAQLIVRDARNIRPSPSADLLLGQSSCRSRCPVGGGSWVLPTTGGMADQAQGQAVVGLDGNGPRVVFQQILETSAQFHRGAVVETENQDAEWAELSPRGSDRRIGARPPWSCPNQDRPVQACWRQPEPAQWPFDADCLADSTMLSKDCWLVANFRRSLRPLK